MINQKRDLMNLMTIEKKAKINRMRMTLINLAEKVAMKTPMMTVMET
jgi:hypothetical protein